MRDIETSNAAKPIGPYVQAKLHNGILYTSGQIGIDPETGKIEGATIELQTEQAIKNLGAVLEAAGSSFSQVIKTTCFLKRMEDFPAFNEIYAQYFTGNPARSCVAAKELPKDALVEIELIAFVST